MSLSPARDVATDRPRLQEWAFAGMAIAALATAAAARLHGDLAAPLWLDESWTGAIAAQPTFTTLTQQVRDEMNAPAYYYLIWAWARAFGISNVALHVPSMILSFIVPLVAWVGLRRSRPVLALSWAVLLACWFPGIEQSDDARCYALLSFAAVLTTLAHLRLLESPSLRRAIVWAASAGFMTLVHYYAGLLALMQGLAFLTLHRGRALRLWPAALVFLPAFGWIALHAPRVAELARTDVVWFDLLSPIDLVTSVLILIGGRPTVIGLVLALLSGMLLKRDRSLPEPAARDRADVALLWVGGAAVSAAAVCVAIALVRPTFTFRYLTPYAPGILLLVGHWVTRIGRTPYLPSSMLLGGALITAAVNMAPEPVSARTLYSFEAASAWLAETRPSRLVFFWDHPATPIETQRQLEAVGGFFLRRAGLDVAVTPLYPTADDMNGPAVDAAKPDAAVLWLFDGLVRRTSARTHPPRLAAVDPGLECRDFGGFNIGVVACRRRPAP